MRLDYYLAHAGHGTRKEVKILLKKGLIKVNQQIVYSPSFNINENTDQVMVNNDLVTYREFQYFLLYKPSGYVSATTDNKYPTVLDLINEPYRNLAPVGRLDLDTTGLLLITNNGKLNHFLLSPISHVDKEYDVIVDKPLLAELIERFANGVILEDGYQSRPATLKIVDDYHATIVLHEGKFHQIKRMFEAYGYHVVALHRVRMDQLTLGNLQVGQYRSLTDCEIDDLLKHMR